MRQATGSFLGRRSAYSARGYRIVSKLGSLPREFGLVWTPASGQEREETAVNASAPPMLAELYVPRSLRPLVHSIWEQRSETPMGWKILPSGRVELIFNLGPSMRELSGKRVGGAFNPTESFCFLSGLHTRPLTMSFPRFHVMGIQMEPHAVKAFFGVPCVEVRDWAIIGSDLVAGQSEIEDRLRASGSFAERARWLERWLFRKLETSVELDAALRVHHMTERLVQQDPGERRMRPEEFTGYSRMHTHRLFNEWTGVPPGEFLRLRRFVAATACLHASDADLTRIALALGYYDHAHFDRHFQRFAAMCPSSYRQARWDFPGQLKL